jgi:hypothetical protein
MYKIKDQITHIYKIKTQNSLGATKDAFYLSLNTLATYRRLEQDQLLKSKCGSAVLAIEDTYKEYVYKDSPHLTKALNMLSSSLSPFQDIEIENIEITYPTTY